MNNENRFGSLAEEYHVASRNQAGYKNNFAAHQIHYDPHIIQLMANAPLHLAGLPRVSLPDKRATVDTSIEKIILNRRSRRSFTREAVSAEQLATLLYLGNGVREIVGDSCWYQRNVPNSGNLGSVEIYPLITNVTGIGPGIYHYDNVRHELELLKIGNFASWLRHYVYFQLEFSEAPLSLILTSAIGRLVQKYGLRGYRLSMVDIGHVSENLYLVGSGMGLNVCASAGFIDDEVDRALGLEGLQAATMLMVVVGVPSNTESHDPAAEQT